MKTTRKIIIGLLVAAGLATAVAHARPGGYGQGGGGYAFDAQDMVAMGPGMMGSGAGPRGGYGPGMMGSDGGPRGGYGPDMMGSDRGQRGGYGPGMAGPGTDPRSGYGPGMAGGRAGQGTGPGAFPDSPRNERNNAPD